MNNQDILDNAPAGSYDVCIDDGEYSYGTGDGFYGTSNKCESLNGSRFFCRSLADIERIVELEKDLVDSNELIGLQFKTYKTRSAESVAGIAIRNLGNEKLWLEIARLNSLDFPDVGPNDYYPVGTVLLLPIREKLEAHNLKQQAKGVLDAVEYLGWDDLYTDSCPNQNIGREFRFVAGKLNKEAKALREQVK